MRVWAWMRRVAVPLTLAAWSAVTLHGVASPAPHAGEIVTMAAPRPALEARAGMRAARRPSERSALDQASERERAALATAMLLLLAGEPARSAR